MTLPSPEAVEGIAMREPKAAEDTTGWRGLLQQTALSLIPSWTPPSPPPVRSVVPTAMWCQEGPHAHGAPGCALFHLVALSPPCSPQQAAATGLRLHTPQSGGLSWYLHAELRTAIAQCQQDGGTDTEQLRKDQNHPSALTWLLFVRVLSLWCSFITCKSQYSWALRWHGSTLQNLSFRTFWETRSRCRKRARFSRGNVKPQLPLNAVKEPKYRVLTMDIWNMWTGLMRGQKPSTHVRNKICPATEQFHRLNPLLRKASLSFPRSTMGNNSLSSFLSSFQLLFYSPLAAILCLCGPHSCSCRILWLQNRRLQQRYNCHRVPVPSFPPVFLSPRVKPLLPASTHAHSMTHFCIKATFC